MSHKVVITADGPGLATFFLKRRLRHTVNAALGAEGMALRCEINILLTDDEGIHAINLEQREVDRPTDVLSFPMNELSPGSFDPEMCEYDYSSGKIILGDMVLSLERCAAQAKEYGHSLERELCYLCVHSVLHLLGYDHVNGGLEQMKMREKEEYVLAKLGVVRGEEEDT